MKTREIPKAQWEAAFKDFSRVHLGQKTSLWVCSSDTGLMREAVGLPLVGISADRTASGEDRIDIMVGDSPDAHVTHQVRQPSSVRLATDGPGNESSLQIESADGTIAFVRLNTPAAQNTPAAFS